MIKLNISEICKILNGSCSIKDFVREDQLIMKCMIKIELFLLWSILLKIPDTLWLTTIK